eukprot:TRINITY_DN32076_c0_g1_i1.p1 TRINITY_DN32076_c0_g1~~TRINITY_DN32076_c0_g1_i1.p1  ORF type:complete len:664 (+),score=128.67 TRINITY_DN32076_c0_g1_i1:65-1993(+)
MEAELEALRRDREEKLKAVSEKKRQVEEMRRRRSERAEQQAKRAAGDRKASGDLGKTVDNLVLEILGTEGSGSGTKAEGALREIAGEPRSSRKTPTLQTEVGVSAVTVLPTEQDVYHRMVQTEAVEFGTESAPNAKKIGSENVLLKMADRARKRAVRPESTTQTGRGQTMKRTVQADGDAPVDPVKEVKEKEMSPEEVDKICKLPRFTEFFERTTSMVERILGQASWDYAADFRHSAGDHAHEEDLMKHVADYAEERWTQGRPVTDCRFSPRDQEVFLASYAQKENPSLSDPDGCVLVWNLAMRHRPEMVFSSQSAVLTTQFHQFNPALFFGGTYSGGVVLWDARAKAGPVQRTPLSGKGHSHPVQAMQQVGTQNATNLITASNDGRLCVWSLAMLVVPQETIDLKNETKNRRDLAVMSLTFPENETNILYVGAEDGSVCQCHIHGSKVGVTELYEGHDGPVTSVNMHPRGEAAKYGVDSAGDLAVSSSFDWSIKVWSVKQSQWPVLSLDSFEDYVYDARWHPTHPAIFASVDGEGHVDLWDLNRNLETPVERCEVPGKKNALNRCHWSCDGKKVIAGDHEGLLSVFSVSGAVHNPRKEDFEKFQQRLQQLQPIMPRVQRPESSFAGMGASRLHGSPLDARH